jgi:hypothetical protein|nr:MAG TPA: hypothetical protein [Caudoviricetes sp.]
MGEYNKNSAEFKNEIEKIIKRIEAETEYAATATDEGLIIDHKKG